MLATGLLALSLRPFALFTLFTLFAQSAIGASLPSFLGVFVLTWTGLTALAISWRAAGQKEMRRAWI